MKRANESQPPLIVVRPHPPERLIRAMARGEITLASGTGCCCCCCLHSLGGLAGAVIGSLSPANAPAPAGRVAPPAGLSDDDLARPFARAAARSGSAARTI